MANRTQSIAILGIAAALLIGCGASMPTKELQDARAAYKDAAQGKAAELVPDKLLSAKQALDRAEAAHNDDSGSVQEKSFSYVAQRMAELAVALAGQAQAQKDVADAEKQFDEVQESMRKQAQDEAARTAMALRANQEKLDKVRKDLADENNKVGEQAKMLAKQEADLAAKKAELEAASKGARSRKGGARARRKETRRGFEVAGGNRQGRQRSTRPGDYAFGRGALHNRQVRALSHHFAARDISAGNEFRAGLWMIVIILSFIGWASMARVIRGMALSLREQQFVLAARAFGQYI